MSDPGQLRRISIERWLDKAAADLHVTTLILEGGAEPWIAAFHAQQAAEKYLKALLVAWQVHFPKTHDLGVLRLIIGKRDPVLGTELKAVDKLTPFAVLDRYPSPDPDRERAITMIDAQEAIATAQQVREAVQHRVQPYLEPTS